VLGHARADRRGAGRDAAGEVGRGQVALVQRAQVVAHRAHAGARERGDEEERQGEGAEAEAEPGCQGKILEALHEVPSLLPMR
jgi:hypothetical protein